jgi:hypothetical protein
LSTASPVKAQALGATSDVVVNLFLSSGIDADGPSVAFINEFGVPVLITDIQVGCSVLGVAECRDVRVFTVSNGFNLGFGVVPVGSEDELKSLTTGVLWLPNEELRVFKNGGGRLFLGIAGIKLAA